MDSILEQIRSLYATANANEKQSIQEQLRDVQREIVSNFDLVWGFGSGVGRSVCVSRDQCSHVIAYAVGSHTDWHRS